MNAYMDLIKVKGVPLPDKFSNFSKHILSGMLTVDVEKRLSSLQVLR